MNVLDLLAWVGGVCLCVVFVAVTAAVVRGIVKEMRKR